MNDINSNQAQKVARINAEMLVRHQIGYVAIQPIDNERRRLESLVEKYFDKAGFNLEYDINIGDVLTKALEICDTIEILEREISRRQKANAPINRQKPLHSFD